MVEIYENVSCLDDLQNQSSDLISKFMKITGKKSHLKINHKSTDKKITYKIKHM